VSTCYNPLTYTPQRLIVTTTRDHSRTRRSTLTNPSVMWPLLLLLLLLLLLPPMQVSFSCTTSAWLKVGWTSLA
jgi:hypothetical protein